MMESSTEIKNQRDEALIDEGLTKWDYFARRRRRRAMKLRKIGAILFYILCFVYGAGVYVLARLIPSGWGEGLKPAFKWAVLCAFPVGMLGILLMLIGWLLWPNSDAWLKPSRLANGLFGGEATCGGPMWGAGKRGFAKGVCTLLLCLPILTGVLALAVGSSTPDRWWTCGVLAYVAFTYSSFLLYGLWLFRNGRDRVVATYLNVMGFHPGTVLIPLTWPLILIVSAFVRAKRFANL